MKSHKSKFLSGKKIVPGPIPKGIGVVDLVDYHLPANNALRLREGCHIFTQEMLEKNVTVGMNLTGALTPPVIGVVVRFPPD
jgi:deoxyhypusine synthase